MRSLHLKHTAQIATILSLALALKFFYSVSSVNELRWILTPTTFLVELFTGTDFVFESHAGYMSEDRTFLIAAPCAGVNFLIIAFVVLAFTRLRREGGTSWLCFALTLPVAYVITIAANTVRIVIALGSRSTELAGFDRDELHRIEGIVVYFGFLMLLFFVNELILSSRKLAWHDLRRRALLPLAIYYAATLGIPLARGSFADPNFHDHAAFVIVVPIIMIVVFSALASIAQMMRDRHGRFDQVTP